MQISLKLVTALCLASGAGAAGLLAGLHLALATMVVPALRPLDDLTFVTTMNIINQRGSRQRFTVLLVGGAWLTAGALIGVWVSFHDLIPTLALVVAAVGYGLTVVVTALMAATSKSVAAAAESRDRQSAHLVRRRYESRWVRWQLVGTVTAAATCLGYCVAVAALIAASQD